MREATVEPADPGFGMQTAGCCEGVEAVASDLTFVPGDQDRFDT